MYIEDKSGGLVGPCRIGRVTFSKTGATLRYGGRSFQSLKGHGFKANYIDIDSGRIFWISGPRRDGVDGLYGRITQPQDVDADVAEEYWRQIRGCAAVADGGPRPSEPFGEGEAPPLAPGRKAARIASTSMAGASGR
ncbi:hypothetical protein ACO2Q3_25295 [Caulobacter sp. KR2-114]|uniref:hypothetical protein n=1 Tax=Caulobacter sp. KR2-114 TaxID=3400912 RepID=UPI003C0D6A8F